MTAHLMTILTFKHTPGKRTPFSHRTSLFSLWSFLIGLSLAYRNIDLPLAYRSGDFLPLNNKGRCRLTDSGH